MQTTFDSMTTKYLNNSTKINDLTKMNEALDNENVELKQSMKSECSMEILWLLLTELISHFRRKKCRSSRSIRKWTWCSRKFRFCFIKKFVAAKFHNLQAAQLLQLKKENEREKSELMAQHTDEFERRVSAMWLYFWFYRLNSHIYFRKPNWLKNSNARHRKWKRRIGRIFRNM